MAMSGEALQALIQEAARGNSNRDPQVLPGPAPAGASSKPASAGLPIFNGGPSAGYQAATKKASAEGTRLEGIIAQAATDSDLAAREGRAAIMAGGDAAADEARANGERAQRVATLHENVIKLFGGDVLNPDSLGAKLVQDIRDTTESTRGKLAAIQERSAVTLLDNPLEFIINSIELPSMAAEYNAEATRLNSMQEQLGKINALANDAGNLNQKAIPAITAEQASAQAKQKLHAATLEAAKFDVAAITQRVSLARVSLDAAVTEANVQQGLSGQQLQAANMRFQSQVAAIQHAEGAAVREAQTAKAMEMLHDVRLKKIAIRNAASAFGWNVENFPISMFDKMPASMQMRFMSGGIAGDFGANPYDAWKALNEFGGPAMADTLKGWQREVGRFVSAATAEGASPARGSLSGAKLDEYVRVRTAALIQENLLAQPVSPSNTFFKELSPATMAMTFSQFDKSVAGTVLKPLIDAGGSPTTQTVVETIANGLMQKGVPVQGQAYAIAQYYKNNVVERNKRSNADAMKIEMPQDYRTTLEVPGMIPGMSRSKVIDLTDPAQVQIYLLYKQGPVDSMGNPAQGGRLSSVQSPNVRGMNPGYGNDGEPPATEAERLVRNVPTSEASKRYFGNRE